jgi:hypothetical protein
MHLNQRREEKMSENNNPEVLADEELDDVSGGGCCVSEEPYNPDDYIPCPKGYDVKVSSWVTLDKCSDCKYILKTITSINRRDFGSGLGPSIVDWWCERPKKQ